MSINRRLRQVLEILGFVRKLRQARTGYADAARPCYTVPGRYSSCRRNSHFTDIRASLPYESSLASPQVMPSQCIASFWLDTLRFGRCCCFTSLSDSFAKCSALVVIHVACLLLGLWRCVACRLYASSAARSLVCLVCQVSVALHLVPKLNVDWLLTLAGGGGNCHLSAM
ncbi:hypothetical protein CC79DRAFT_520852 [Sarocladium strictum]